MTNMKAAERAAELANAEPGSDGLWDAKDFLYEGTPSDDKAFAQFIADADAAAREVQSMAKECEFSLGTSMVGKISRTLSPLILPDDVDPLEEAVANVFASPGPLTHKQICHHLRTALASRGLEIVEQGK